ncbi:MAG TPA: 2-oxoglutarate dehydrogenase, E2 component, dihydrolipoamide succinyltransferase [Candidatus Acidoferrales bacterium]|nr:2-oxoglutarate dehydrogenase, E2 component, dihydrolipoamide succinyltransferase [Candidatus Acidoferrales bacterium]
MAVDVIMPQMGESIFEGTITKWLKKAGDKIERDEPLFEISTDKVDAEIPSPSAGVLKEIKVNEGQTVPIQTVVAIIDADGAGAQSAAPTAAKSEEPPSAASGARSGAPANAAANAPLAAKVEAKPASPRETVQQKPAVSASGEKVRSSPLVRRIAREHDVDLTQVPGSGAGGRVSKSDILAAVEGGASSAASARTGAATAPARTSAPPPATGGASASAVLENAVPREKMYFGHYEVQPMSVMRQRIAEHMVLSKHVSPHVYSVDEVNVSAIAALRTKMKNKFEETTGTKLTFMPFFVRAAVEALRAFPTVNASVDGTNIVLHKECNIGVAVALDWGLIVPVIKNAEEKNFLGLARAMNDLAERARTKKLKPEEVAEGTFAITNPGVFGGLFGLPIINQPNVAILGLGTIEKRPVVIDDAIAIRSMVYLTLSYDHRVVDGAVAHQFMGKIKHTLENWTEAIL